LGGQGGQLGGIDSLKVEDHDRRLLLPDMATVASQQISRATFLTAPDKAGRLVSPLAGDWFNFFWA
jgi:hypothetical protein